MIPCMVAFAGASRNAISTSLSPSETQPRFLNSSMSLSTTKGESATSLGEERFEARAALIMGYRHS
jgi:hypothetical protein